MKWKTLEQLKREIERHRRRLKLWTRVAAECYPGVNHGTLIQIVKNGHEPTDTALRQKLGLAPLIPVEPCPTCGVVHSAPCPRKVRRKWSTRPLSEQPPELIRWRIENRTEDFSELEKRINRNERIPED